MKTFTRIFMAVVALFAFACTTDTTFDQGVELGNGANGEGETLISLSMAESRTQLGEYDADAQQYPMYWSEDDQISVNGVSSTAIVLSEDKKVATFTIPSGSLGDTWRIAYPAAADKQVEFAVEQTHTNGTFGDNVTTMYALSAAGANVELHHLTGVLKIGITGSAKLTHAQISTIDRAPIAGSFNLDFESGELTATDSASEVVEYSFGEGVTLSSEPTYIHAAVPAGVYDELYVTLYDNEGGVMYATVKAPDTNQLEVGTVREFKNNIPYAPNTSLFVIKDYATLCAFKAAVESTDGLAKDAVLVADVTVPADTDIDTEKGEVAWSSINGENYTNTLRGNGYAIKGLKQPLFKHTAASIKGVHLEDVNITATAPDIAPLACAILNSEAVIEHCSAKGKMHITGTSTLEAVNNGRLHYAGLIGYSISTATFSDLYTDVDIELDGTYPVVPYIAGSVTFTTGKLVNVTNHGSMTFKGTAKNSADTMLAVHLSGVTYVGIGGLENCINGMENSDGTVGSITVTSSANTATLVVSGLAESLCRNIHNCHNYGNLNIDGNRASTMFGGFGRQGNPTYDPVAITDSSNHGKITISGTATGYSYSGGFMQEDSKAITTCTNCHNHGDIEYTSNSTVLNLCCGGLIGRKEENSSYDFIDCTNTGDISHAGYSTGYIQIGGLIGCFQQKSGVTSQITLQNCTNEGGIDVNGSAKEGIRIGGIIGSNSKALTTPNTLSKIINKGCITFSCSSEDGYVAVGGIIGGYSANLNSDNIHFYNDNGDITCTNTTSTTYVGGIVGNISAAGKYIKNAYCFCDIKTTDVGYAGMYCGGERVSNASLLNNVGGTISFDGGASVNELDENNYVNYVYGFETSIEEIVLVDEIGYISSIDAQPKYAHINTTTNETTYVINSVKTLNEFATKVKDNTLTQENIIFTEDVDMTNEEWSPIEGFTGLINGQNHAIKGLTAPLFGTTQAASIKDLKLTNVAITSDLYPLGALACKVDNTAAVISNCSADGTLTFTGSSLASDKQSYFGGLIGHATASEISSLVNSIDVTFKNNGAGWIGGCVGRTEGSVIDCQNLGTITFESGYLASNTIWIGGVCGACLHATNCKNGDSDENGKTQEDGKIVFKGKAGKFIVVSGITCVISASATIYNCTNYAAIEVQGEHVASGASHQLCVGGINALPYHNFDPSKIEKCQNYGTITVSTDASTSASYAGIGGICGGLGSLKTIISCTNYGEIKITNSAKFKSGLYVGGILSRFRSAAAQGTFTDLHNVGKITISANKVDGGVYVGGITSHSDRAHHVNGELHNEGEIVVGSVANSGSTTSSTFDNVYMGGIFGCIAGSAAMLTENHKFINQGDLTLSCGESSSAMVGGIVGSTLYPVSDARCHCTVTAWGYANVGMIMGNAYDEATKATNCHIGGVIDTGAYGEYTDDDNIEVTGWHSKPLPIRADVYYKAIYSNRDIEAATAVDNGCGYISAIDAAPVSAEVE